MPLLTGGPLGLLSLRPIEFDPNAMRLRVDTAQAGSANDTFVFPANGTIDAQISWGDGTTSTVSGTGDPGLSHSYASPGIYNISITGNAFSFRFNDGGDKAKLLKVLAWGAFQLSTGDSVFKGCTQLTTVPLDTMPIANTTMADAFSGCVNFASDLSAWIVGAVTDFSFMFFGCSNFSPDLSGWDVSSATSMAAMFLNCTSFTSDVSNWVVSSVINMSAMFRGCPLFTSDLSGWVVGTVTNMAAMFLDCISFTSDLSGWDVSSVTNMAAMFRGCTSFTSDLSSWVITSVTNMGTFLSSSGITTQDYSSTLIGWEAQSVQPNVSLGSSAQYNSAASSARAALVAAPNNWTITDGGLAA